ncbi:MAG: 5-formyltetrahydrofolate cyclo-ligase [Lachnospiraceae bacterium]|nr:5-formyltetrahydrofolate cyclo-ligase [Lachnospiraceae bacterium]
MENRHTENSISQSSITENRQASEKAEAKKELRRQMSAIRKAVPDRAEKSRQIFQNLNQVPAFQEADRIFLYVSCWTEVETREWIPALLAEGRSVAVPRVEGSQMAFYAISGMEDLQPGAFGILEPKESCPVVTPEEGRSCMLLPGLAFDEAGHRMGYGGGYYDKYLAQHPDCVTVAVAYAAQIIPTVPVEPHDRILNWIVTEKKIRQLPD